MTDVVSFHNPDRYMTDLRHILSQGRKRIGILLGAGGPVSVRTDEHGEICTKGAPLIPAIAGLTNQVKQSLKKDDKDLLELIESELDPPANIEAILSRTRAFAKLLKTGEIHNATGPRFSSLAENICKIIADIVEVDLPAGDNAYTQLAAWISGTERPYPIEIFTPNYDLLIETALERNRIPYFDGFVGSKEPFFDPTAVAKNALPSRWARLWKLHGSLGWEQNTKGRVIRRGNNSAATLIYPDHLKYDHTQKQPYTTLFDRLRTFLSSSDSILITSGFSFFDTHITAVIEEGLSANPKASLIAFQFSELHHERCAIDLAKRRPNMSVYALDGAVINTISAKWKPEEYPSKNWEPIRDTFWRSGDQPGFILGDFTSLTNFLINSNSTDFMHSPTLKKDNTSGLLASIATLAKAET
ncbi:SIR2 family protein [Lujinxingia sediminis]|uniref:SIR2 family protein n=1 Tax=Lujinxingia sediminis TaxID=2480984 RepID=A0ABY0CRF6_9DELT|nr:SIR2 family protein [Lujinxingia sediminis]RVU43159.1 SIR2 family protein [Lujinxingia sediminis]